MTPPKSRLTSNDVGDLVDHAFNIKYPWLFADYIPFLFLQSQSSNVAIKINLKNRIASNKYHKNHINMDMRDLLLQLPGTTLTSNALPYGIMLVCPAATDNQQRIFKNLLKEMVGVTGIEPVTPSMSTKCYILQNYI
jgi:hypothetical protein